MTLKRHLHPRVYRSIINSSQGLETTRAPSHKCLGEQTVAHGYSGTLFSHEEEGNSAICDTVDGPRGHYVK